MLGCITTSLPPTYTYIPRGCSIVLTSETKKNNNTQILASRPFLPPPLPCPCSPPPPLPNPTVRPRIALYHPIYPGEKKKAPPRLQATKAVSLRFPTLSLPSGLKSTYTFDQIYLEESGTFESWKSYTTYLGTYLTDTEGWKRGEGFLLDASRKIK